MPYLIERGGIMNAAENNTHITHTSIGGTMYIVESMVSDNARETAYSKVKRLILSNVGTPLKVSESSQILAKYNSTSA
jgi:hypothetical protein